METELEKLSQEYQKRNGALTVKYEGKEQTLQQMGRYLESTNRAQREEAWKLIAERRLKEKNSLEELFDKMLKIRAQAAKNAGFPITGIIFFDARNVLITVQKIVKLFMKAPKKPSGPWSSKSRKSGKRKWDYPLYGHGTSWSIRLD